MFQTCALPPAKEEVQILSKASRRVRKALRSIGAQHWLFWPAVTAERVPPSPGTEAFNLWKISVREKHLCQAGAPRLL